MQEHWYQKVETQVTTTIGAVGIYSLTLNEIIGILTVILLVGQIGILVYKYYKVIKEGIEKRRANKT